MSPRAKPSLSLISPYVPGAATAPGFINPIKLSANENPFGCCDAARAAYLRAADEIHLYPDSNTTRLRQAISAKYDLEPERLVFGAGSDELFAMATQAFISDGENIVQPQYAFAAWAIAARGAGGEVKSAPECNFFVDVDAIAAAIDERTRVVFLANPANPTGTCLPFTEIERMHAAMPPDVLLVLDGAYADCACDQERYSDGLHWARDKSNVLVTRTFSKAYGLAALRVGWAYAPAEVAQAMNQIRLPFSISRAGEAAAVAALADERFLQCSVAAFIEGRRRLAAALGALGIPTLPSATNFVTANFADARLDADGVRQALARSGVLVRGLSSYDMPDWLRISVGRSDQVELIIDLIGKISGGRVVDIVEDEHIGQSLSE